MESREPWRTFAEEPALPAFSASALAPLFELNGFFLDCLIQAAGRTSHEARPALALALATQLTQLTPAARECIARCPVCLSDMGFRDEKRWGSVASLAEWPSSPQEDGFPPQQGVQLAQM